MTTKHQPATPLSWQQLPRSERAKFGRFECDIWRVGGGARYTVLDTETGHYVKAGQCADLEWARQVSSGFANSLRELGEE